MTTMSRAPRVELVPSSVFAEPAAAAIEQPLRVWVLRPGAGVVVLQAEGVLDAGSAPRFAERLRHRLAGTAEMVVLELSRVSFLDTAGALTLLEAATGARVRGKTLRVISSRAVDRLLELIEKADRFTYAGCLDDVMADMPTSNQVVGADVNTGGGR